MKIAVIGAAGKAGALIVAEAKKRGHDVTAIVRPESVGKVKNSVEVLAKNVFDLTSDDLSKFEAVVSAIGTQPGKETEHVDIAHHLINVFKAIPQVRLLVVGGAASLYQKEGSDARVLEELPPQFRGVPSQQMKALDEYKASDINWTFFSPAYTFDPVGLRTGKYELGGDYKIYNKVGASYISYADYAVAMVDEIENNAHPRQRFTAVSCDPYFREAPQYIDISKYMFSRRGAWFALSVDTVKYGQSNLYITTLRGNRTHSGSKDYAKLYKITPVFDGKRIPFAVQSAADELTVHTTHGDIRFTWANETTFMAEGDKGMGLLFERTAEPYEVVKPRKGGAWESPVRGAFPLTFKGLEGSDFRFDNTWDWYKLNFTNICGRTYPDADGKFTLAVQEHYYCAVLKDEYPTYAEAKAKMHKDFYDFLEKMPHYIQPFESKREETAYVLWSHLVAPGDMTPSEMILMFPGVMATQWQMVQNAVALQEHHELSIDLLIAPLHRQSEDGQIADAYDESFLTTGGIKPPVYGWALKNIMAHHDISQIWPREKIEKLYDGAGRWVNWFTTVRDEDGDGLPSFEGGSENGFDEVSIYWDQVSLCTPDIVAYTILNLEAQGDLAKVLGKPEAEINEWYDRAKTMLDLMIEKLWNGERFIGITDYDHKPVDSTSNIHYLPFILGNRLPKHIADKMAEDLSEEGGLLSRYGLTTERMDSDLFRYGGTIMGCGPISAPAEIFILTGMWEAGHKELAREIIDRYCGRMITGGFNHFIDPFTGEGSPFYGTWNRCVYTILSRMVSEG